MAGKKQVLIALADSNKKGKEFVKELDDFFSVQSILSYEGNEKYHIRTIEDTRKGLTNEQISKNVKETK